VSANQLPLGLRLRLAILSLIMASLFLQMTIFLTPAQAQGAIQDTGVNPYGVNTFLDKEVEFWKKEKTMQMIQEGGFKWIKQIFAWNELEFRKGYFYDDKFKKPSWQKFDEIVDLAQKYNIQIVARLDQTPAWAKPSGGVPGGRPENFNDYADFLKEFVKHYKGKVKYIQVWNEPNLEREWMPGKQVQPRQYAEMLKIAYKAVKETDPSVRIMAAPLAITTDTNLNMPELDFLREMYKAGAKESFDIMPANAYGLEYAPEDAPDPKKLNFRRVELLRKIMEENGDSNKSIWFNEFGWNASPANMPKEKLTWRRVTEQQQSEYTVRAIQYARKNYPWFGVALLWFFRQVGDIPDSSSEQYFQVVTKDFVPKPVYNAVKEDAFTYLRQNNLPLPVPQTPPAQVTSTPVPSGNVAPNPAATQPGNTASAGTPAATQTGVAGTAVAGVPSPTVAGTVASTAPAATPPATIESLAPQTPVATASALPARPGNPAPTSDGTVTILLVGGALVLMAGGGLAIWAARQVGKKV
jgi:hypothetical protein